MEKIEQKKHNYENLHTAVEEAEKGGLGYLLLSGNEERMVCATDIKKGDLVTLLLHLFEDDDLKSAFSRALMLRQIVDYKSKQP